MQTRKRTSGLFALLAVVCLLMLPLWQIAHHAAVHAHHPDIVSHSQVPLSAGDSASLLPDRGHSESDCPLCRAFHVLSAIALLLAVLIALLRVVLPEHRPAPQPLLPDKRSASRIRSRAPPRLCELMG